LDVTGLKCGGCVSKCEQSLKDLPGVKDVSPALLSPTLIWTAVQ
ncbi:unnamed protein product, partial [Discosporangium mesarthrocarpum]